MRRASSFIALLIAVWFFGAAAVAVAQSESADVLHITHAQYHQRIARGISWLEDPEGKLTLEQIRAADARGELGRYTHDSLQFGYSRSTYWFRFSLSNEIAHHASAPVSNRVYVAVRYPLLDDVQLYAVRDGGIETVTLGDGRDYFERRLLLSDLVFPLTLAPQEKVDIYLRVHSVNSLSIPVYVSGEIAFIETQSRIEMLNGIYFGIAIGLFFYNVFLWIGVRKRIYAIYVLFMAMHTLFNATMLGYTFVLWPSALHFQQVAIFVFSLASGVTVVWFGTVFLQSKIHLPRWHRLLSVFLLLTVVAMALVLWLEPAQAAQLNALVMVTGIALLLPAAALRLRQGYRPAWYYLIGQGAVLASVGFTVLTSHGLLPYYYLASEVLKWASAFEILFFSIGLADLVNEERRLREAAQRKSETSQHALLQVQIELNEDLDKKVRVRTRELEVANAKLQTLSTIDDLTKLYNRRHINEAMANEYRRAFREKTSIALLMLDIDHFKKINDDYGHPAGDACLVHAARIIANSIRRPPDVAARFGGEEFVVLLPNTTADGARVVADNILRAFNDSVVALGDSSVTVSISIGIASVIPHERDGHEQLLAEADRQLYSAKQSGRNRVASV